LNKDRKFWRGREEDFIASREKLIVKNNGDGF
jgi:hypothetical protein